MPYGKPDIIQILQREGITLINNVTKCVFHDEKTASLRVYPGNNSYYCFGCKAGGDSIDFIMQLRNLSYRQALNYLHVKPPTLIRRDIRIRELTIEFNAWWKEYFEQILIPEWDANPAAFEGVCTPKLVLYQKAKSDGWVYVPPPTMDEMWDRLFEIAKKG